MMQLSDHFHLSEFVRSDTARALDIWNVPPLVLPDKYT